MRPVARPATLALVALIAFAGLTGCGKKASERRARAEVAAQAAETTPAAQPTAATQAPTPQATPEKSAADKYGYVGVVISARTSADRKVDVIQVQSAINLFAAQEGRAPATLQELVERKYLPVLPALPHGYRYAYDRATSKVTAVTN